MFNGSFITQNCLQMFGFHVSSNMFQSRLGFVLVGNHKTKKTNYQIWSTPYIWSNLFFFVVYAFSFWTQCYLSWLGIAIHMFGKGSSLNPFWQGVGSKMFYVRFHVYPMKLCLFLGAYSQPKGLRSKPQSSAWELNQSLFPPGFWPNSSRKKSMAPKG